MMNAEKRTISKSAQNYLASFKRQEEKTVRTPSMSSDDTTITEQGRVHGWRPSLEDVLAELEGGGVNSPSTLPTIHSDPFSAKNLRELRNSISESLKPRTTYPSLKTPKEKDKKKEQFKFSPPEEEKEEVLPPTEPPPPPLEVDSSAESFAFSDELMEDIEEDIGGEKRKSVGWATPTHTPPPPSPSLSTTSSSSSSSTSSPSSSSTLPSSRSSTSKKSYTPSSSSSSQKSSSKSRIGSPSPAKALVIATAKESSPAMMRDAESEERLTAFPAMMRDAESEERLTAFPAMMRDAESEERLTAFPATAVKVKVFSEKGVQIETQIKRREMETQTTGRKETVVEKVEGDTGFSHFQHSSMWMAMEGVRREAEAEQHRREDELLRVEAGMLRRLADAEMRALSDWTAIINSATLSHFR